MCIFEATWIASSQQRGKESPPIKGKGADLFKKEYQAEVKFRARVGR